MWRSATSRFHPTSLIKFRNRLIEGGAERVGFGALLDGLHQAGLVKKGSKQRLDSTHVLGAVAHTSRLELVRETIRLSLAVAAFETEGIGPEAEIFLEWASAPPASPANQLAR